NPDEVRKFARLGEAAQLLLRVSFRAPGAVCDLSRKFGCDPEDLLPLARLAADLGIGVRGLSFHVGSQTADAGKHVEALAACARLMAAARRERLGAFDTLDIGGGFPIEYGQPVQDIGRFCAPLRAAVARLPKRVRVIAENLMLPQLRAGDLVVGRAMGAYTWASASEFNFFPKATVVSVNLRPGDTGSVTPWPL